MTEYHKINSVFKRDPQNMQIFLMGEWATPEFGYLANNEWIWTEKVDGTNIRVIINNQKITFEGRENNSQIPASLVSKLNEMFMPQGDKMFEMFPDGAVLYGEGYGAKIQKGGGNYRSDQSFVLFDVKIGDWWLQRESMIDIAVKLSLTFVPVVGKGTLHEMVEWTKAGPPSMWGPFKAEGVVAKPAVELMTRGGDRIITKVKYKDFSHETLKP